MTIARAELVDPTASGIYHCISRCVRRAMLCGDDWAHRKNAIQQRLMALANAFAIDVAGYAILDNHFHTVLRTHPERARTWSAREVTERWARIFPASILRWAREIDGTASLHETARKPDQTALEAAMQIVAADEARIATLRERLANLSWFMKCLKEWIARSANREDNCRGHFFEARFKSIRVLDPRALLATLVYVDLNVIRALQATTPESSDYTSAQDRIHVRQLYEKQRGRRERAPKRAATLLRDRVSLSTKPQLDADSPSRSPEDRVWLAPIDRHVHADGLLHIQLDEYLTILDAIGRIMRPGKRGAIPSSLPPILQRLTFEATRWSDVIDAVGRHTGTVLGGNINERVVEARRRGRRWVRGAHVDVQEQLQV